MSPKRQIVSKSTFLRRTGSRALAFVAFLIASTASLAGATELNDPSADFHMTLDTPGAAVCVVIPTTSDTKGCEGLDPPAIAARMAQQNQHPAGLAIVRYADWGFTMTVIQAPGALVTQEQIASLVKGTEEGLTQAKPGSSASAYADAPGARYDIVEGDHADMVRYALDIPSAPGSPGYATSHMLFYGVSGKQVIETVSFIGSPLHAGEIRSAADAMAKTIRISGGKNENFGRSQSYVLGYLLGKGIGFLFVIAVVVVAVVVAKRRSARQTPATRAA